MNGTYLDSILSFFNHGLTGASPWMTVLYALIVTHITIASVTIYLHRAQAHRALDVHIVLDHFFRFWLWMTTSMITREWAAIHRKHHAKCETVEDPHSPQVLGLTAVLRQGAELYRAERRNEQTIARYSHGTPNDWVDRNVYQRHMNLGVVLMLITNVALFGAKGIAVWAVQMMWIPILAAGVVNGIGHYFGYRNFPAMDASTNIFPWGILIGGEELHNNHHSFPTSARLSMRWFEFDIGWFYINILKFMGLVKVKHVAPRVQLRDEARPTVDMATAKAVVLHRYEVMSRYTKVMKRYYRRELKLMKDEENVIDYRSLKQIRDVLTVERDFLSPVKQAQLQASLKVNNNLEKFVEMRDRLFALWKDRNLSNEQLVAKLQAWCEEAERSQILALQNFSLYLRRFA